jgi:hypothetical protein
MILNQEAASDAVITAAEQSLHVKEAKIDPEVKSVFEILQLEFANRIPDITLELIPDEEELEECEGMEGLVFYKVANFRAVDAESILDDLKQPAEATRRFRMQEAGHVNVFIEPFTKPSGTVRYQIYFSWQYRKDCCDIKKYSPCLQYQSIQQPTTSRKTKIFYYLNIIAMILLCLAVAIGFPLLIQYSIEHPVVTVEATCEALSNKANEYCGFNNNNSTSSSSSSGSFV